MRQLSEHRVSVGRLRVSRWLLIGIAGVVSILAAFVAGEIMVRFAAPQAYMVPRWKYSADSSGLTRSTRPSIRTCRSSGAHQKQSAARASTFSSSPPFRLR